MLGWILDIKISTIKSNLEYITDVVNKLWQRSAVAMQRSFWQAASVKSSHTTAHFHFFTFVIGIDGTIIKSICSFRGVEFIFYHPHNKVHNSLKDSFRGSKAFIWIPQMPAPCSHNLTFEFHCHRTRINIQILI